ncbi:hypothetical protein [Tetragenococcus halophilus]|uniref:hypothetical protein n=1 Tax=Tetragenococcus halophilus TaxID=51669 RepID=UPI002A997C00|nr:hypothetical protein TEHSL10_19310 [Tetragenococcus halophilus]
MNPVKGSRFKVDIHGMVYNANITHVNKGLYIIDFYYDGEFRTSKAVDKQFFKRYESVIDWDNGLGRRKDNAK